jgi:Uma2 family endonuclease
MHEDDWQMQVITEQRVQVAATRFRIPDVCVLPLQIDDPLVVRTPPVLCIEILSREDRMSEMQERVDDYLRMGVRAVWVLDPWRRKAFAAAHEGELISVKSALSLDGTAVHIALDDVFRELDRLPMWR